MWPNVGRPLNSELTNLHPDQILYEFDGPRIFTCRDLAGDLLLAYMCEDRATHSRFVIVPFTEQLQHKLMRGSITMRDALDQPRVWLAEVDNDWKISSVRVTTLEEIPADNLPRQGAMLWPHLQPLISVKATGKFGDEFVSGSVVKETISAVEKSLHGLIDFAREKLAIASSAVQPLYELSTQRLAFGSLEIAFRSPDLEDLERLGDETDVNAIKLVSDEVSQLLRNGIEWANRDESAPQDVSGDREHVAVLAALSALAPTGRGEIEEIAVSGALIGQSNSTPVSLRSRTHKRAVKELNAIKKKADERPVQYTGLIKAVADRSKFLEEESKYQFDLQTRTSSREIAFELDKERHDLWNDVLNAIRDKYQVDVSGIQSPKSPKVKAISILPTRVDGHQDELH